MTLNKVQEEVCWNIWGCVPLDTQWVLDSKFFQEEFKKHVDNLAIEAVFGSMALEGQEVSKEKLRELLDRCTTTIDPETGITKTYMDNPEFSKLWNQKKPFNP